MIEATVSPAPDLRLLSAAIGLDRFTVDELATLSDCNVNTARSWVRRMRPWLLRGRAESIGRGRPRTLLHLSAEGRSHAQAQMEALRGQVERRSTPAAEASLLDRAQMQFEIWREVSYLSAAGEAGGDAELEGLRLSVGECWRHFAHADALGEPVGWDRLLALAELEAAANIVVPDPDLRIEELAGWLVDRMVRIRNQDGSAHFAARALHARIEARPAPWRATAAALAATVWSDEDRADDRLSPSDWADGLLIAEEIAPGDRRKRVETVLLETKAGSCEDDDTAQAVVRGLTACRGASADSSLRDWLASARWRSEFREVFAPVVVHGLLEADGATMPMLEPYRGRVLDEGLRRSTDQPGLLRRAALSMSRRIQHAPLPGAGPDDLPAEPSVAVFGSGAALRIVNG